MYSCEQRLNFTAYLLNLIHLFQKIAYHKNWQSIQRPIVPSSWLTGLIHQLELTADNRKSIAADVVAGPTKTTAASLLTDAAVVAGASRILGTSHNGWNDAL